jgi:(1->4)-alpha-D-glucan 1-alpha-D-glucosylmutase
VAAFRATYRLQLEPGVLDLHGAKDLLPYLDDLGVSHLYLSPVWQAREGSTHGYDVVDPAAVSTSLGGEAALRALADAARERGMGLLLDVVPNHMATDDANRYWTDERERFFDVDHSTDPPTHRRFFDIGELAGVRQEDPEVFAATHAKALELVRDGVADGLRIDHPDGLADPKGYLDALRDGGVQRVWVEKILEHGEELREDWATEGTVGYEFILDVDALLCDPEGEGPITELWEALSGDPRPFAEVAAEAKLEQARTTFTPEVERLRRLHDVPGLVDGLAALPVYRTYLRPGEPPSAADEEVLAALPGPVQRALRGEAPDEWVVRFQQTSGPVMAKGVEDTAFYRFLRFVARNEVGGDPARWSIGVDEFHRANVRRLERFPNHLLSATTHDTKRSADVRSRLLALAGMAEDWAAAVRSWEEVCAPLVGSDGVPDGRERLLIFQTLLGAWPLEVERLEQYLTKALREAKLGTNWIEPVEAHEAQVMAFARALYDHGPFRYGFDGLAKRVAERGERLALARELLRLTVPGVPDVYQGDETWALSLVDPDNRRPVDFGARREALAALRDGAAPTHETAKLHLVAAALDLRRRRPATFAEGAYVPVAAGEDVCAFLRGDDVLVAVALRDRATGAAGWELPADAAGTWRDVLTGAEAELPDGATLGGLLGPDGRVLLERLG